MAQKQPGLRQRAVADFLNFQYAYGVFFTALEQAELNLYVNLFSNSQPASIDIVDSH